VKGIGGGHAAADLMEKIDRGIWSVQESLIHGVKLRGLGGRVKRKLSFRPSGSSSREGAGSRFGGGPVCPLCDLPEVSPPLP
jgi:hypothetical protein